MAAGSHSTDDSSMCVLNITQNSRITVIEKYRGKFFAELKKIIKHEIDFLKMVMIIRREIGLYSLQLVMKIHIINRSSSKKLIGKASRRDWTCALHREIQLINSSSTALLQNMMKQSLDDVCMMVLFNGIQCYYT